MIFSRGIVTAVAAIALVSCGANSLSSSSPNTRAQTIVQKPVASRVAGVAAKSSGDARSTLSVPSFNEGPPGTTFTIGWNLPNTAGPVTWSATGLPSTWTETFSPNPTPGTSTASVETVQSPITAAPGQYTENVIATFADGSQTSSPFTFTIDASYDAAVRAIGPYAYYELNETSGTVAVDSSGHNHTGTFNGASGTEFLQNQRAIIPTEPWGSMQTFGVPLPSSAPITMGHDLGIAFNGTSWVSDISVAAWIQPSSSSEAAVAFEYNGYGLGVSNGNSGGNLAALNIPCTENINSPAAISDGVAHFVVGTVHANADGSTTAILYVDGVLVNQANVPICNVSNITPNTAIGADASAGHGQFAFAGFLSGAVVFSQALTLNQVQSLYQGNPNLGSPSPSPSPSPTPASAYATAVLSLSPYAFYELNEASGTVAADSSGNGRTGTYNGSSGTTYLLGQPALIPGESWTSIKTLGAVPNSAPVTMGHQVGIGFNGTAWASDLTIVSWLKPSSLPQTSVAVEINGYGLAVIGSSAAINVPCGTNVAATAATFADGKAHFVAAVVHEVGTTTALTLYVDGVLAAQQSNVPNCNESSLNPNTAIGANSALTSNGVFHYSGYVSGVAVFSSVLSNAQILALFQSN